MPDPELLAQFTAFVDYWLENNLAPIPAGTDTTVETWLKNCKSYPAWRKEALQKKFDAVTDILDPKHKRVKSFQKDENYLEYKQARAINSRSDEFKAIVGPICKLIDEALFRRPEFVKKIPVRDRPQWIIDELEMEGCSYAATDFTAFEAHFRPWLLEACEFRLYRHLTQLLHEKEWFIPLIETALAGTNLCIFKWCTVSIVGTRMSGEMTTSSGNGFTNLMLSYFLHYKTGNSNVKVKVEGDDGLHRFQGVFPSQKLIDGMGLKLKIDVVADLASASFCGMVFDRDDLQIVTEPLSELANFGWTTNRYLKSSPKRRMELLRSKALSLCYQYDGCPILGALGRYGLRVTHGYRARGAITNEYEALQLIEATQWIKENGIPCSEPQRGTRDLFEKLYNLPLHDQYAYEDYLDSLDTLQPLSPFNLTAHFPTVWRHYYENYSVVGTRSEHVFPGAFYPLGFGP